MNTNCKCSSKLQLYHIEVQWYRSQSCSDDISMKEIVNHSCINIQFNQSINQSISLYYYHILGGLGGVVVIDAAFGAHGKSRPRFKPGTLFHRCSDLGQVVNLPLSVA